MQRLSAFYSTINDVSRRSRTAGEGFVICCFNNNYKIAPQVFDVWMRLLKACPESVLWLLADNPYAMLNLRREAAARGVAPERLVFAPRVPRDDHLARHRLADLFLDTLPVNAHATASDALWSGLPLLTFRQPSFLDRREGALGQLSHLNRDGSATQDCRS